MPIRIPLIAALVISFSACQTNVSLQNLVNDDPKVKGYFINYTGSTPSVYFLFDKSAYTNGYAAAWLNTLDNIWISGSFNNWNLGNEMFNNPDKWRMDQISTNLFTKQVSLASIGGYGSYRFKFWSSSIASNSGYIEPPASAPNTIETPYGTRDLVLFIYQQ